MLLDIEYLLLLQRFRIAINDALTPILEPLSLFAVTYLILVPVFIYWTIDKKKGLYVLATYSLIGFLNSIIKLSVCAYRPWIRDARVVPAGDAIRTATGYSFPSGHTAIAGSIYGGLTKKFKEHKLLVFICMFLLLVTGFTRNYLGVHTPQDVLFALALTWLSLLIIQKLFDYLELNPEKENIILLFIVLFAIAGLVYITFKPYPLDYVNGELLVSPYKMMNDGYGDTARLIAFCLGRFIERKWIKFKPTGLNTKGIIVSLIGVIILGIMITYLGAPLDAALGTHWGHFTREFIFVSFMTFIYPFVIKVVCK